MAAKNTGTGKQVKAAPAAPAAPTAAELYKASIARQAETHAVITQRLAPFCVRAGVGSRAWALDLAICELHAEGAPINVQSMIGRAQKLLESVNSPVIATPGSHFSALTQRKFLVKGANGYTLTEHGIKQAEACGALKPAAPAPTARKPKGKK
jgi:hypothetical protein